MLDWDPEVFAAILSLLRYQSLSAIGGKNLGPDMAWRMGVDLRRLGLVAEGEDGEVVPSDVLSSVADIDYLLSAATEGEEGGRRELVESLCREEEYPVDRAVEKHLECGTAVFLVSQVVEGKEKGGDGGEEDGEGEGEGDGEGKEEPVVLKRMLTLNRVKIKWQKRGGKTVDKAVYDHGGVCVVTSPELLEKGMLNLSLKKGGASYTIQASSPDHALVIALTIRRFNQRYAPLALLDT